ncbi:unnamed protein product, partial [Amoebophrya sp. A25]
YRRAFSIAVRLVTATQLGPSSRPSAALSQLQRASSTTNSVEDETAVDDDVKDLSQDNLPPDHDHDPYHSCESASSSSSSSAADRGAVKSPSSSSSRALQHTKPGCTRRTSSTSTEVTSQDAEPRRVSTYYLEHVKDEERRIQKLRNLCWKSLLLERVTFKDCEYWDLVSEHLDSREDTSKRVRDSRKDTSKRDSREDSIPGRDSGGDTSKRTSQQRRRSPTRAGKEERPTDVDTEDVTRTPTKDSNTRSSTRTTSDRKTASTSDNKIERDRSSERDRNITSLIKRDVNRTLPSEPLFQTHEGQQRLFRVLKAVSRRLWEVGYCQGLNFVVATLLLQFDGDELLAFQASIAMLWRFQLIDFYSNEFRKIRPTVWKFDQLVKALLPKVAATFEKHGVSAVYYALSWFMTLFSADLPQKIVRRVWDLYFAHGERIIHQVALALLYRVQRDIVALAGNFEHLLKFLKTFLKQGYGSLTSSSSSASLSSSSTSGGSTSAGDLQRSQSRQDEKPGAFSRASSSASLAGPNEEHQSTSSQQEHIKPQNQEELRQLGERERQEDLGQRQGAPPATTSTRSGGGGSSSSSKLLGTSENSELPAWMSPQELLKNWDVEALLHTALSHFPVSHGLLAALD